MSKESLPRGSGNKAAGLSLYVKLFWETMKISAFTFGGGYVIVTLMRKQFVEKLGWIDDKQMLDYTAISQSAPGSIAVNASILVGYGIAGVAGAAAAVIGTVLPPLILLTLISYIYKWFIGIAAVRYILLGMQAGVAATICDAVINLAQTVWKQSRWAALIIAVLAFVAVGFLSVNVMLVIVVCLLYGIIVYGRKPSAGKPSDNNPSGNDPSGSNPSDIDSSNTAPAAEKADQEVRR